MNFYNDLDPAKAEWMRQLMAAGVIAKGHVDERSIKDIKPADLDRFRQCHFFAGIGVWSYALRLAGWPDEREVWTGSCPCQPFSVAGKRQAEADERHLWPAWFELITKRRPVTIFGEQVADSDGQAWLDNVQADLESVGYRVGSLTLPAAGFGAPHGRHRTFFVADTSEQREQREQRDSASTRGERNKGQQELGQYSATVPVADTAMFRHDWRRPGQENESSGHIEEPERLCDAGELGNAESIRLSEQSITRDLPRAHKAKPEYVLADYGLVRPGPVGGFWSDAEWLWCKDNKWRAAKPGSQQMAHGFATDILRVCNHGFPLAKGQEARTLRLRGYGDSLVLPVAKAFIEAYMSCL